jgi:hypothetical protein
MRILAVIVVLGPCDYIVYKAIPAIAHQLPHETRNQLIGSLVVLALILIVNVVALTWLKRRAFGRTAG